MMKYKKLVTVGRSSLIYLGLLFGSLQALAAQQALPDSSDWDQVWDTFWASDDLLDVWPVLDELEQRYARGKRLDQFVDPAIGLLREAYEYGFFPGSRSRLKRLGETLSDQSSGEPEKAGRLYFELARSYFFSGQHDSLRHFLDRSLTFYPPASPNSWDHYNLSGVSYLVNDDRAAAITDLLTAREKLLKLPSPLAPALMRIESNLGQVYQEVGDLSQSLHYRRLSLNSAESSEADGMSQLPLVYGGLANLYDELGQYDLALDYFEQAISVLNSSSRPDSGFLADLYLNTGVTHKNLGAYDQAEANYWRAESIYRTHTQSGASLAQVYANLANLATFRSDFEQAIELHLSARTYYQAEGDVAGISTTHTNIGIVYTKSEQWEQALAEFQTALAINQELAAPADELATDYLNLSDAYRHLAQLIPARAYADSALQLINDDQLYRPNRIYSFLSLARIEQAAANPTQALDWVDQCLLANLPAQSELSPDQAPVVLEYLRYDYLFEALLLRAELLMDDASSLSPSGDPANAQLLAARELLNIHGSNLISQEDRIQLARFRQRLAETGVQYAFNRWENEQQVAWVETAFQYAEFAKAGVLREVLLSREARDYVGIPEQLQQREDSLRASLALQRRQLLQGVAAANSSTQVLSTEQALAEVIAVYDRDYPAYADLLQEESPVRLSAIQFALQPAQLVQYYFSSPGKIYGFTISKEAVEPWSTSVNPQRFARDITAMRKGITRRLDRIYRAKAWSLYQQLFPLPFPEGTEEVVLVPDGALLSLPFEALLTQAATADLADHELAYLLREQSVAYSPSANLFYTAAAVTRQSEQESWDGLLGFAPVFLDQEALQTTTNTGPVPTPLPGTQEELAQLERIFSLHGKEVVKFTHRAATEEQVYSQRLQQARFIHFATHGFVDARHPELSAVLLYPGQEGSSHDGRLTAGEISHLRISAELVVLSACETARGRLATGEGLLGLSRSFLHAGAEHLIVSLWPVQDAATAQLMLELYRKILSSETESLSAQLRAAKLQLIGEERWAHPYYWSPFVLVGG